MNNKAIAKRAKEYADRFKGLSNLNYTDMGIAYKFGAVEQKAFDMEEAHKAFVELLDVQYGEECNESLHQFIDDTLEKYLDGYMKEVEEYQNAYNEGATVQRQIDEINLAHIERERDAYYDELQKLRSQRVAFIDNVCAWLRARNVMTDASIEGFRKVMEEWL